MKKQVLQSQYKFWALKKHTKTEPQLILSLTIILCLFLIDDHDSMINDNKNVMFCKAADEDLKNECPVDYEFSDINAICLPRSNFHFLNPPFK